jgi:3-hydroxyisobutyrate dehydrogenase-like beta-hydroxyacid dehydrogenase
MGGFASSRVLEVHGERVIKRTFEPGFRTRLHQKDLGLALQGARELGLSLPQTVTAARGAWSSPADLRWWLVAAGGGGARPDVGR